MFSIEEYLLGWFFYLAAVMGLLTVFWRITQAKPTYFHLRQLLRLSIAVLLLTPYFVDTNTHYLAPAWAVAGLDVLFSDIGSFWRSGGPLLLIWCTAIALYILAIGAYHLLKK